VGGGLMHVFIIGAPAAGKMTIGQELSKLTGATLFFNHQTIDFALEIYQDFTEEMWEFVRSVNFSFLGTSARNHRSVILTGVTDFSNQYHLMYLKDIQDLLNEYHQEILFVELETSLEERLRRNRTENRLKYKPLKRHFEVSEREILETDKTNQLNSQKQPSGLHHYLKIDNTNLSAEEVAKQIQEKMKIIEKGHIHV
jgi:shikimate kinase